MLFPFKSSSQILYSMKEGRERENGTERRRGQRQSQSGAAAAPSLFQQSKQLSRPCWGETSASCLPAVLRHPPKTEASFVHAAAQLHWNACSHAHIYTKRYIEREHAEAFCSGPTVPVFLQAGAQSRPWRMRGGCGVGRIAEGLSYRAAKGRGAREGGRDE